MRTVDRVLAFVCAVSAVFALSFAAGRIVGPVGPGDERPVPVQDAARRPGDPARLVASSAKIRHELGWQPRFPELATMVETAWKWRLSHPRGYEQ